MRNVLLIGSDNLIPFAEALNADGLQATAVGPGAGLPDGTAPDLVVLEMEAVAEDAEARRLLAAAQAGEGLPVIGVLADGQLQNFDPTLGLDDFLLASARPEEICLRVRQLLWKRERVDPKSVLKCGSLVMDLANYTVHVAGRPVELTYKEWELLHFLAANRDRVFNRETLLNKVWGYDFYGGARTVDVHVRRLRAKIEDRHNTFIETVRNVGYRFRALP